MITQHKRNLTTVVLVLICGAGIARFVSLVRALPENDRGPSRTSIAAIWDVLKSEQAELQARLAAAGVDRVRRLRFDESAAVIVTYGGDGQPGAAGVDDNRDQIIDNALEIGAIKSDDQCLAPWQEAYQAGLQQDGTIAISRGTFVLDQDDAVEAIDQRFLLHGRNGNEAWTWMFVP